MGQVTDTPLVWSPLPLLPLTQSLVYESLSALSIQYTVCSQVLGVYVSLVMLRQMIAPHEAFLTLAALEALVSCEGNKKRKKVVGVTF